MSNERRVVVRSLRLALPVVVLAMLAGCASPTPFKPADADDGFGYVDQTIETDRVRVAFAGNSVTSRQTVETYLLYRAAEVTVERGYDYFLTANRDVERNTSYFGNTTNYGGLGYGRYGDPWGYGGFGGIGTTDLRPIDSYTAFLDIKLFKGTKPSDQVNAYDARQILQNLGPSILRPGDARG
ncbi:CC0125/CC1285 family lipoprotein [Marinivivus vitaminiproducens]|uniref:CC0125/CC1285 family lipoprotein n=1 Tax=Marinivivus vitaminiproducens TaxID=3035935 RepID=UPI0027990F88|nr:hypothetical protein P4R82_05310 [Geminicoccaceae bacterium SCSIO 64248]